MRAVLKIKPNSAGAYANLISCFLALGRPEEAKAAVKEAQARNLDGPLRLAHILSPSFKKTKRPWPPNCQLGQRQPRCRRSAPLRSIRHRGLLRADFRGLANSRLLRSLPRKTPTTRKLPPAGVSTKRSARWNLATRLAAVRSRVKPRRFSSVPATWK